MNKEMEMAELEKLNELSIIESPAVEAARIPSPVKAVEESLSKFVADSFNVTRQDFAFGKALQDSLMEDLETGALNQNQKIALYSSYAVNNNDKISKLINPVMQLMTARQQSELALAQAALQANTTAEKTSTVETNKIAPKDILQGMKQLQDFMSLFHKTEIEEPAKLTEHE